MEPCAVINGLLDFENYGMVLFSKGKKENRIKQAVIMCNIFYKLQGVINWTLYGHQIYKTNLINHLEML
ncbi:hypothetical protein EFK40_10470 [Lactococcus lactis subsp. lactis]|nr:hypothetical protein [Lactococcus lactis subsp. lactis]